MGNTGLKPVSQQKLINGLRPQIMIEGKLSFGSSRSFLQVGRKLRR